MIQNSVLDDCRREEDERQEKRDTILISHVLVTNRVDVCTLYHDKISSCFKDSTSESHAVMILTMFVLRSASSYALQQVFCLPTQARLASTP